MSSPNTSSSEISSGSQASSANGPQSPSVDQEAVPSHRAATALPKISFKKRSNEWEPSEIDERCFFYCVQNQEGRIRGQFPLCSSYCYRRVYNHEISTGSHGTEDRYNDLKPTSPIPLPAAGQPAEATDEHGQIVANEKTKQWQEGVYLWTSNGGSWIIHDKIISMAFPLSLQAQWALQKESAFRAQREAEASGDDPARAFREEMRHSPFPPIIPVVHPLDEIRHSLLLRISPISSFLNYTLYPKISFALKPTYNLLGLLGQSFEEGGQARFFQKACEQATNGSALRLMRNAWSRREMLWKKIEDVREDDGRKKKKGGDEEI